MNNKLTDNAILIADSGATKADWYLVSGENIIRQYTGKGITPVFQSLEEMAFEIKENVLPQFNNTPIQAIYFYGSGCIAEKVPVVREAIHTSFPLDTIDVYSDLVAAAHAL